MQHFGYNIIFVILLTITSSSCATNRYSDDDMARMATVVRTAMNIIKGKYYYSDIPSVTNEKKTIEIVLKENSSHFKEMEQFDGALEIKIISNGKYIGVIVWNSDTNRKLIQDLRCTLKLDDKAWKREALGSEFNLDWNICKR